MLIGGGKCVVTRARVCFGCWIICSVCFWHLFFHAGLCVERTTDFVMEDSGLRVNPTHQGLCNIVRCLCIGGVRIAAFHVHLRRAHGNFSYFCRRQPIFL